MKKRLAILSAVVLTSTLLLTVLYAQDRKARAKARAAALPFTNLTIQSIGRAGPLPISGWEFTPVDLNSGVGGNYIYAGWQRGDEPPITRIGFASFSQAQQDNPYPDWEWNANDLNRGAGGRFIYMFGSSGYLVGETTWSRSGCRLWQGISLRLREPAWSRLGSRSRKKVPFVPSPQAPQGEAACLRNCPENALDMRPGEAQRHLALGRHEVSFVVFPRTFFCSAMPQKMPGVWGQSPQLATRNPEFPHVLAAQRNICSNL